VIQNYYIL